ncbi:uncharacterized protein LOC126841496 isoform X4 [Adelges cooleyi]|uniref:uncharacterized protein LOC126841496 isoform X4 n=1 Tax=Adelges cooleyi TaxID=133065 RepID=UPI00217FDEE3|nr:uncharacterized protein LOC126841496 isoform X4 [Adelges cooleyi]
MLDINNVENYMFNVHLSKIVGLYQVLNPNSLKIFGYNAFHILALCGVMYVIGISVFVLLSLYFWMHDVVQFFSQLIVLQNIIFMNYKIINVIIKSDAIWNCLAVVDFDCTAFKRYDKRMLKVWRKRSILYTNVVAGAVYLLAAIWIVSPYILKETYVKAKHQDGTFSVFHYNVFNMYFLVTDTVYNKYFFLFHLIESSLALAIGVITVIPDIVMIMLCIAITGQLDVLMTGLKNVGYDNQRTLESNSIVNGKTNAHETFQDLLLIIADHQFIIKKAEDFCNIFRPIIFSQILVYSSSLVVYSFISFANYFNGATIDAVQVFKTVSALLIFAFQLFILCYLFGNINEKKDSIIFALYSSNWPEMDGKCKQLVLLTMQMNNANLVKLRITEKKVVNLEFFVSTMNVCFSIFSLLKQYSKRL